MKIEIIRMIWAVVAETPPCQRIESFCGRIEQIRLILHNIDSRVTLSPQEHVAIKQYLVERQHLIQDFYVEHVM